MKEIKVLAIGNSFSEDATRYLHQIAAADGVLMKVVNLYIGGCPLERHWQNILTGEQAYQYQENGVSSEKYVSVEEMLAAQEWDYITLQQASHDSGWCDTYEPFLELIIKYIREKNPAARILLHETWAYEIDSTHGCFWRYHCSQQEMFERLFKAYHAAAERYGLQLIPAGELIQKLRSLPEFDYGKGGMSLCRDGYHMHFLYGRYAVAAVWYGVLTGRRLTGNSYLLNSEDFPAPQDFSDEAALPAAEDPAGEKDRRDKLFLIQETVDTLLA